MILFVESNAGICFLITLWVDSVFVNFHDELFDSLTLSLPVTRI